MSSDEVSIEGKISTNNRGGGDMVEFTQPDEPMEVEEQEEDTRKRTPPTLQCWDKSTLPTWQAFVNVLQDPNTIYIGLQKYTPASSAPSKWSCGKLSYLLYTGKITPADYRRLYEKFVRQKLWSDLHELEGKRLVFFKEDMNKCNGPILLRLFAEKFRFKIDRFYRSGLRSI